MPKKTEEVIEDQPICREKQFASVLAHAIQLNEHLLEETGGDMEVLENSHVAVSGDFLSDCFDLLIEYALRYEGEIFAGVHDDLIKMYEVQNKCKTGFGSKTVH